MEDFCQKPINEYDSIKDSTIQNNRFGGFLGRLLEPLVKVGLLLMRNVFQSLAKSVLLQLGVTAVSAGEPWIHKNILKSETATLIISKKGRKDIVQIVKSINDSEPLTKDITRAIEIDAKEQRGRFFGMQLDTRGATLLENMLSR